MAETQVVSKRNLPTKVSNLSDVRNLLDQYKEQFQMVLPKMLPVERLFRMALYAVTVNPALLNCDPKSFLRSVLLAASFGLEPGGPKAHLVPFRNTRANRTDCQLIIDYKGLVDLARRSGQVSNIISRIVWDKEPFEIDESLEFPYRHKQLPPSQRGTKKVGVYSVAKGIDSRVIANDWMWAEEVEAIKERSLNQKKNPSDNPWVKFEEEMWKKSPIRRMAKMMPQSPELQQAAIIEEAREAGLLMSTPIEVDLGLSEEEGGGTPGADIEGKTENKTDALKEKFKSEADKNNPPSNPSMEQTSGPAAETSPPTAGTPGPEAAQSPGADTGLPPDGSGQTQEQGKPTDTPQPELPATGKRKGRKQPEPPDEQPQVPEIEQGKKRENYWVDAHTVRCPPKGDKHPYMVDISYCNKLCPLHSVCFVVTD